MLTDCSAAFVETLAGLLPPGSLRAPEPRDLEEPRGRWTGRAGAVALPRSTEDVATLVRACGAARVGIVPLGGGTGLVGGQVMPAGPQPLVVSLERLTACRGVWPEENVLVAEAGMVLAEVQAQAARVGRLFPLSLASEGSARIGGCLSTNAGGTGVLRYGNARDLCLGIEAVLPDGSVLHGLKRLRKDNTGYDLRHLLIGAEGTLGILTAASLKMVAPPAGTAVAMLVVESPAVALDLLALAQGRFAGLVSGFELIAGQGLRFLAEALPEVRQPFASPPDWSVLVELGLPSGMDPEGAMASLLDEAMEKGLVSDGVVAASGAQAAGLWHVREAIPLANRKIGAVSSHDVSLPLSEVAGFIAEADRELAGFGDLRVNCFGHLGDGNLHYNAFPAAGRSRGEYDGKAVQRVVHDLVHARGGSVSAEHGIGRLKVGDLVRYGDPARLAAMRAIKAALDPLGIMNPGAVLG